MKFRLFSSTIILCLAALSSALSAHALPTVRIGIVLDGPWGRDAKAISLFKQEIRELNAGEFKVIFPANRTVQGNWTVSGVRKALNTLLKKKDVNIVIALGYAASHEAARRKKLSKPVIAPFVIDAELQRLPHTKKGTSGVRNLNYIDSFKSVERDIQVFKQITPFKNLAILVDSFTLRSISGIGKRAPQIAKRQKINVNIVTVKQSMDAALKRIPVGTDAVMVGPLIRLKGNDFQRLVKGLKDRKLPSFSLWSRNDVESGILAGMTHDAYLQHLARNVAVHVHEILRRVRASRLSVAFTPGEQLAINMATARAIDICPSLSMQTEADLLNEQRTDIQRMLTFEKAVQEAIAANRDLAAAEKNVAAGLQAVRERRADLLPQIGIGAGTSVIDEDRAQASLGQSPEKTMTGSATLSQLLYSDKAWSNYSVQKHLQKAREEGRNTVQLDIIQAASTAYLNVLRAKTLERIQKDNLRLTRANLERARVRQYAGIAGPEEVYRWESEIARNRQVVLESESLTMNAMNALNRLLNRPLQEQFIAKEAELSDPLLALSNRLFSDLVSNPKQLELFKDFVVQEGFSLSPELQGLDAQIAAQRRTMTSSTRALWLPDLSLQADVSELFSESGAGTREERNQNASANPLLNELDTTAWSVGVYLTFPLFTSGQKSATYLRSREEFDQVTIERAATAQRIEERILAAVNFTRASYPGIQLSRDAAEAADKNLALVADSYAQGIKTIIDLIDGQNLALVADQRSANSVYNFLIDLMNVQRSVGRFDFFQSESQRQAWYQRFESFASKAEQSPSKRSNQ